MAKYEIETEWSGYSRGTSTYVVEAVDEDEAREMWYEGERTKNNVVRDDTENEITGIKEIGEK